MAVRANPEFIDDLQEFGADDVAKCYQCGNCSAACPHSKAPHIFPRRAIKCLQLGLEEPLRASLDPWLCYYCGDCSTQCPRGAEPGETMMSLRRWLTSKYDFTGISRLLYTSRTAELVAVLGLALLTGVGFLAFGFSYGGGNLGVYDGPGAFLPTHYVHIFDWTMGIVLALLLSINSLRMWHFTMRSKYAPHAPLSLYVRHVMLLPYHFFTQKKFSECEKRMPWIQHLVLMLSYLTMLVLIMVFLRQMQAGPQVNWYAHFFGYLSAIGLLGTTILSIRGRIRKDAGYHQHSHDSDWVFLILLAYVTLTGIAQHVLHRAGLPLAANITYVVHLMGVVPMLVLEVPFGKWSHLAYRPLGVFLARVQDAALEQSTTEAAPLVVLDGAKG